jgi:pimeloyl-ACP methyl ester carboxylesterase
VGLDTQLARAPDGRGLTFAQWGDPNGFPVFSLHGTPDSRCARHWDENEYAEVGARLITYDRPGYGGSDRNAGRSVVDCVGDVAAIADVLGVERFAVTGGSGGGPHALAVAARLSERVTRAGCAVGIAPYDAEDIDWFDGMDPLNVREFEWALQGEEVLRPELEREAAEMKDRVDADASKLLGDEWGLSDADRMELARPERAEVIRQNVAEAFRNGVWGWVDDDLCFAQPWGFDVAEIRVPTRIIFGLTDVLVPAAHGHWLARHVPGAEVVAEHDQGHLGHPELVRERLAWLLQQA